MNKVWKAWLSRSSDRLKPAIKLAYKLQKGRSDSFKTSYIEHVRDVAFRVSSFGDNTQIVALLHGAVEDKLIALDTIRKQFGTEVADAIHFLIKEQETLNRIANNVTIAECAYKLCILPTVKNKKERDRLETNCISTLKRLGLSDELIEAKNIYWHSVPWFHGWLPYGGWAESEKRESFKPLPPLKGPGFLEIYMNRPVDLG